MVPHGKLSWCVYNSNFTLVYGRYIYTIPMVFVNQFINGTPKNIDYPLYGMVLGTQFPFPYISIVYTLPILDTLQKIKFFAG